MTAWGVGSLFYDTGYASYDNPYCEEVVPAESYLDYSEPLAPSDESQVSDDAMGVFTQAQDAFKSGDYPGSLSLVDQALSTMPNDSVLHEFRSLVLFALGRYDEAAAGLYAVLSVGPGWDWTTMSSLYSSTDVYTQQLRALEQYIKGAPKSAPARFVLAYHYMTCGETDAAAEQYREVIELQPGDQLSAQLLKLVSSDKDQPAEGGPPKPGASDAAAAEPPAGADPIGTWAAPTPDGGSVTLALKDDGSFTWTYAAKGKTQDLGGKYEVSGSQLSLQYSSGGSMVGQLTWDGVSKFNFSLIDGPPGDPGLSFVKK